MTGYKHILNTPSKDYSKNVYTAKASYKKGVLEKKNLNVEKKSPGKRRQYRKGARR